MKKLTYFLSLTVLLAQPGWASEPITISDDAYTAAYSLDKVHRWLHEVALPKIDDETGLYIADGHWNYRDTAADCYPFLAWAAYVIDEEILYGPVLDVLKAETERCAYLDRIPAPFDFETGQVVEHIDHDELVFQASEYVKDGLIAIVEVTGKGPWFDRMYAIQEDLWKHAHIETDYGKMISENVEVNGEQLQALARLYTMTGEARWLEYARRITDHYLADPDWVPTRLRDHGCEMIGGLGLHLAVEHQIGSDREERYTKRIKKLLDDVIAGGANPDGFLYNAWSRRNDRGYTAKDARGGDALSDGWGYNYVTYLLYDMVSGGDSYTSHVNGVLSQLGKPYYCDHQWGERGNIDGYADSIEGAMYCYNRVPNAIAAAWIDREIAKHVVRASGTPQEGPIWETMKLEANGVRTTIMHAMMKQHGVRALPWQPGLKVVSIPVDEQGMTKHEVTVFSEQPWQGKLKFDPRRHELYAGFERDWPRMNTLPEWFHVDAQGTYDVTESANGSTSESRMPGKDLIGGLDVALAAGEVAHFTVALDMSAPLTEE